MNNSLFRIWAVAANSFLESVRTKAFLVMMAASLVLILSSLLVAQLAVVGQEKRVVQDFGLFFISVMGVVLAVTCGRRGEGQHAFEKVQGSLAAGIGLGFLSALCQAVSVLIARPIMASGVDAVAASALRVATAALLLNLVFLLRLAPGEGQRQAVTGRLLALTAMSGTVGMALGMTFILFALAHGPAGLVSTLSATSPILILPILWVATGQRPRPGAWVGAMLTVLGVACIFSPWAS